MERLTTRDANCAGPKVLYGVYVKNHDYISAANRLADYEDTELTPEEVSTLVKDWSDLRTIVGECGGLDRVRALAEADKDGRVVVHGRWISWEEAGNFVPSPDRHECSVCHDAAQVLVNGFELLSDYCPNCGAKMDGGADHEAG